MDELENKLKNHVAARLLNIESRVAAAYDSGKPFFDYNKPLEEQWIDKELFDVIKLYFDEREEIVHCRDCKYFYTANNGEECCENNYAGLWDGTLDSFCSWGVRKEV